MEDYAFSSERRVVNILCSYWNNIRGNRPFPTFDEIEMDDLSDIISYCFCIDVLDPDDDSKENYVMRYVGSDVMEIYNPTIQSDNADVNYIKKSLIDTIYSDLLELLETQEPIICESEYQESTGDYIKLRQCLLPVGKNNIIEGVIGAVRYKVY